MRILVLATSRPDGRSSTVLDRFAAAAVERGARIDRVDARTLPVVFPDQDRATFPDAVGQVIALATAADVIFLGGPVFRSAVSGFTRLTLEVLRDALVDTVVVPVLGAGSARATLVGNDLRADLILNFHARPTAALVVSPEIDDAEIATRVDAVLESVLRLVQVEVAR